MVKISLKISLLEGEHCMSGQLAHVTLSQEKLEDKSLHVFRRRDFEKNIIKFLLGKFQNTISRI